VSVWTEPTECALCGNRRHGEVKFGLIHRPENLPGMQYEHIPRCVDKDACAAILKRLEDSAA